MLEIQVFKKLKNSYKLLQTKKANKVADIMFNIILRKHLLNSFWFIILKLEHIYGCFHNCVYVDFAEDFVPQPALTCAASEEGRVGS